MKILIVGPSWVGDMVMAQTLFKLLKQRDPQAEIDVLAPVWSLPLMARMAEVRYAIAMPLGHGKLDIGVRRTLGKQLAISGYDQAIVLPNSLKSALVPWFASIPRRTGWRGEMRYLLLNDIRVLDKDAFPRMIERFAALAGPAVSHASELPELPWPELQPDLTNQHLQMQRLGLTLDRPVLALCPGAEFGEAKRWPESHYAEVAAHYLQQGWQVWLFGSAKDQHGAAEIIRLQAADQQDRCFNLAGQTELADAVDLLALAHAVVSNDSGLMHVAAALQRPLVAVYGSTSPMFTPPLGQQVNIVRTGIDCSPCFQRSCPYGHYKCLKELPSQQVLTALAQVGARP
ncbi:lipopolysaccharide heptosyltransferase II [Pokkaliibacter plantistimulans]|uniref:lipopolysaccharide heptosyltransferase II n=1 Tax=Proteobacteria bacterium 228 TaxID=2083153 RepID=A0A2S5KI05_9PROT|nr:lipopolysaccharide heptosyltransferase II [Pokkaliibacter plantistimulans]PPC74444.1 lipopolysaccharide heptosyltransferase II [Pokkaliibacter plantistimulans]